MGRPGIYLGGFEYGRPYPREGRKLTRPGFAIIFARLSDFIGRRSSVLLSFLIFIAFSLGGGFAKTLDQLIVCRTLMGVGGSGLYALALIVIVEVSTAKLLPFISVLIVSAVLPLRPD